MATFSQQISSNTNDVTEQQGVGILDNFCIYGRFGGATYVDAALRFTGVTIPSGASISAATLSLYASSGGLVGSPTGSLKGVLGNCAAWATTSPNSASKTTASVAPLTSNSNVIRTHDVTALVQEIVNGTWSSGNAMGFIFVGGGTDGNYQIYVDFSTTPAQAAALAITYTAGGTNYNASVNAATTPPATVRRGTAHPVTRTTTPPAVLSRGAGHALLAVTTPLASVRRALGRLLAAATTPPAVLLRGASRRLPSATTPPASLSQSRGLQSLLAAATTPVASARRALARLLPSVTTPPGLLLRGIGRLLPSATTPPAFLAKALARLLASATTPLAGLSFYRGPVFSSTTGYGPSSSVLTWTPFAGLDLSAYKAAIFVTTNNIVGGTPYVVNNSSSPGWQVSATGTDGTFSGSAVYYQTTPTNNETLVVSRTSGLGVWTGWLILITHSSPVILLVAGPTAVPRPADPPSVDTGAPRDFLAIATASTRNSTAFTAGPAGYENFNDQPGGAGWGAHPAFATRQIVNTQSEDPGTFTGGATGNQPAFTIAIYSPNAFLQLVNALTTPLARTAAGIGHALASVTVAPARVAIGAVKTLPAVTTPPATLRRPAGKLLPSATTPPSLLLRGIGRLLPSATTPPASIQKTRTSTLAVLTTPLARLGRGLARLLPASTVPPSSLQRAAGKRLAVQTVPPASVRREVGRYLRAATTPLARLTVAAGRLLAVTTLPVAAIRRAGTTRLAVTEAPVAGLSRGADAPLAISTAPVASVRASFNKFLGVVTAPIASLLARLFHLPEACFIVTVDLPDTMVTATIQPDTMVTATIQEATVVFDTCDPKPLSFPARYVTDSRLYGVRFAPLEMGETIAQMPSVDWQDGDSILSDISWNDDTAVFRISGGTPIYHRLTVNVVTSSTPPNSYTAEVTIAVNP